MQVDAIRAQQEESCGMEFVSDVSSSSSETNAVLSSPELLLSRRVNPPMEINSLNLNGISVETKPNKSLTNPSDSGAFDMFLNQKIHEKVDELLALQTQSAQINSDDGNEGIEENGLLWNLNAIAVVCVKGYTIMSCNQPGIPRWRRRLRMAYDNLLRLWVFIFCLLLVFSMVAILVGLHDQYIGIKTFVYGDGYHYSFPWRYAKSSLTRDKFRPVFSKNGMQVGVTADILGSDRPAAEASRCMNEDYLMPVNEYQWGNRTGRNLWALLNHTRQLEPQWAFSHCLVWEYANLCVAVMEANLALEAAAPADRPQYEVWRPGQCYLPSGEGTLSLEEWRGLSAPPDEIRSSHRTAMMPRRVEPQQDLAMWVMSTLVGLAKQPYRGPKAGDPCSMFLYTRICYLYALGVGDAYLVELIAITVLSFYLFFTSFLDEVVQLLCQVLLASHLRCYEAALLDPAPRSAAAAAAADSDAAAPAAAHLHARVRDALSRGPLRAVGTCLQLLAGDVACDVFLALRVLFLALMTETSSMVLALDHGVLAVIFSVLAIAFLFEFDDTLLRVSDTVGFRRTRLFREMIRPCLEDCSRGRRKAAAALAAAPPARPARGGGAGRLLGAVAPLARLRARLTLQDVSSVSAIVMCAALFGIHQAQTYSVVTDNAAAAERYDAAHHRVAKLGALVLAVAAANTVAKEGLSSIVGLGQLGCCFGWVYSVYGSILWMVLLGWFRRGPSGAALMHGLRAALADDAWFSVPCLAIYVAAAVLRPVAFILGVRALNRPRPAAAPPSENCPV